MARRNVLLQLTRKLQAIHDRHHHVADYQLRHLVPRLLQALATVCCLRDIIPVFQDRPQIGPHPVVVIDDEHQRAVRIEVFGIGDAIRRLLSIDILGHIAIVYQFPLRHRPCLAILGRVVAWLGGRQRYKKPCALSLVALHADVAMMEIHVGLDQRQSNPRPTDSTARLVEAIEEMRQRLLLNSLARIAHAEHILLAVVGQCRCDPSALRRIF